MNEETLIARLKNGDRDALKDIYLRNKAEFFRFSSRYDMDEEVLEDIYQDAIIILWEKAQLGKIDSLKCSIKTYLFSVTKYMIYDYTRKSSKFMYSSEDYMLDNYEQEAVDEIRNDTDLSPYQVKLLDNFKKLGEKCREILNLFYYRGFTIEEIMEDQGYESKNVTKSQKSRCLKSLKEFIRKEDEE